MSLSEIVSVFTANPVQFLAVAGLFMVGVAVAMMCAAALAHRVVGFIGDASVPVHIYGRWIANVGVAFLVAAAVVWFTATTA